MSNVFIVLQEEEVLVALGRSGAQPVLQKRYRAPVRRSGIEGWEEALRELWSAHSLPTKGVTLCLPGNAVTVKTLTVPEMPEKKLAVLVRQEMQSRTDQEVVTDFQILGKDEEGRRQLYCVSCPQNTLERYLNMLARLNLKAVRITEPLAGCLRVLEVLQPLKDRTCVWLSFEGGSVLSILVENGVYRYSSRSRIFSEPGTIDFGTEISRGISGMLQFHASQRSRYPITHVYYSSCPADTFEVCLPNIQSLGLAAGMLPGSSAVRLEDGLDLADAVSAVGAMVAAGKQRQINLYRSYQARKKQKRAGVGPLRSWFALPVVLLVLGLAVWGTVAWQNHRLNSQIAGIEAWLNDPEVIARYELSQEKQAHNRRLLAELREVEDLTQGLATYPEMNSKVLDRIRRVGGETVQVTITGYSAVTGELSFEARSAKVIDIPDYVLKLQKTDLFHSVDYTGYEYRSNGDYVLHLGCLLQAPEGEEVTP